MKTLLLSFLLLFSVKSFSQNYVSKFVVSYRVENSEWVYIESEVEENVFSVRDGYIYWSSDRVVRYKIVDVEMMDGVLHYFLSGVNNHPLLMSYNGKYLSLIFDAEDGNRYVLKYTIEVQP